MEDDFSSVAESLAGTPASDIPLLTVSPADTSLNAPETKVEETKTEEKKPPKKRKSWGQELPIPKTNLPPRYVLSRPTKLLGTNSLLFMKKTGQDRR
jgi:transcriptional activator HAC1